MISIYVVMFPKWCALDPSSLWDYLKWYEITTVTMGITFFTVNRVVNRWRFTIYTVKSAKIWEMLLGVFDEKSPTVSWSSWKLFTSAAKTSCNKRAVYLSINWDNQFHHYPIAVNGLMYGKIDPYKGIVLYLNIPFVNNWMYYNWQL